MLAFPVFVQSSAARVLTCEKVKEDRGLHLNLLGGLQLLLSCSLLSLFAESFDAVFLGLR